VLEAHGSERVAVVGGLEQAEHVQLGEVFDPIGSGHEVLRLRSENASLRRPDAGARDRQRRIDIDGLREANTVRGRHPGLDQEQALWRKMRSERADRGGQAGASLGIADCRKKTCDDVEASSEVECAEISSMKRYTGQSPARESDQRVRDVNAFDLVMGAQMLQMPTGSTADVEQGVRAGNPGLDQAVQPIGLGLVVDIAMEEVVVRGRTRVQGPSLAPAGRSVRRES
jgi:hypothetical protein